MKVDLEIMGPARRKLKKNPSQLELPEGSNVMDLMKHAGYTDIEAKYLVYVRDGETLKLGSKLNEGDFIKAVLQIGGG